MDYSSSHLEAIDQATSEPARLPRSTAEVIQIIARRPRRAPTPDQPFRHAHLVYDEPQPEGARTLRVRIPRTDPEAR